MSTLIKEITRIQSDMVNVESMVLSVMNSAYNNEKAEIIGCSLEILQEYIAKRVEELDKLTWCFNSIRRGVDYPTGEPLSDKCTEWEKYMTDDKKKDLKSKEVDRASEKITPLIEKLSESNKKALMSATDELRAASRKQGFAEGMLRAITFICGEECNE